ncbi:hypothetical protein C8F04DRAFT_1181962 [Mycena alexandri]|uniref:Uncharacterized protein n=1 Tax=Mycena alexandri TaxID=1745969 RepID=A0AAD6SY42_9AGAR|nr:hypothetical protein C8F04DRAFT_1181962 [Mycena alexandri]
MTSRPKDRTHDHHLPLDPIIYLHEPELRQLVQLLADPKMLDSYLNKRFSRVMRLIENNTSELGPSAAGWHTDLARLHYPLRSIYKEIDSDRQPLFDNFKNVLLKTSKHLECGPPPSPGPSRLRGPQIVVSDNEDDPMEDETPTRYTLRDTGGTCTRTCHNHNQRATCAHSLRTCSILAEYYYHGIQEICSAMVIDLEMINCQISFSSAKRMMS